MLLNAPALALLCGCLVSLCRAAEVSASTNIVRQTGAGKYEIGLVKIDASAKRLTVPAQVNMVEGPIEYVLVTTLGKVHESIFKTEAQPAHIHAAALLLLKESPAWNKPARFQMTVELPGGKSVSAEELILDQRAGKPLAKADWHYTGSRIVEGEFLAQRDGSIVSIIADPDALAESGRVARDDDDNWVPVKTSLPAVSSEVQLVLTFAAPRAKPD